MRLESVALGSSGVVRRPSLAMLRTVLTMCDVFRNGETTSKCDDKRSWRRMEDSTLLSSTKKSQPNECAVCMC